VLKVLGFVSAIDFIVLNRSVKLPFLSAEARSLQVHLV
jgi:hypothetical protein